MRGSGFLIPTTEEKSGASTREPNGVEGHSWGTSDEQSLMSPILCPAVVRTAGASFAGRRNPGPRLLGWPQATMLVSEKNRLSSVAAAAVRPRIEAHIAWLERELDDLDKNLRQTLRQSPLWRDKDDLLRTVPGIGERVSFTLLAYLPELGSLDRRQIAALAARPRNRVGEWLGV